MKYLEITTIDAALAVKGLTVAMIEQMYQNHPEEDREEQALKYTMDVVEDVLNAEDPIDWSNTDKLKWRHWWDIEPKEGGSSGVGLSLGGCICDDTYASVGARRSFASKPIAKHAAEHFRPQYEREFELINKKK